MYFNQLDRPGRGRVIQGFVKDASTKDRPNDLNAFIVRTPNVRNATDEISVLNDDALTKGY